MKKNFAIDFNNSELWSVGQAIKLAKENGYESVSKNKSKKFVVLTCDKQIQYCNLSDDSTVDILTLPRDWDKVKDLIGVEPKAGEIWIAEAKISEWIYRIKTIDDNQEYTVHSHVDYYNNKFYAGLCIDVVGCNERKATPEEAAKLEAAEREKGYYWDGKELVKIPEYVKDIYNNKIYKVRSIDPHGYNINHESMCFLGSDTCKPATKEEYEAQEKKKTIPIEEIDLSKWDMSSVPKYYDTTNYKAKYEELKEELDQWQKRALEAEEEVKHLDEKCDAWQHDFDKAMTEITTSNRLACSYESENKKLKKDLLRVKAREQEYRAKWKALKEKFQFFGNAFHGIVESDEQ